MPASDICARCSLLSINCTIASAIDSGVWCANNTTESGISNKLFSICNSTTGNPAAIISKGILDGLDELIHNPTLHLLYNSLHFSKDIIPKFSCSNHTFPFSFEPNRYIFTCGRKYFTIPNASIPIILHLLGLSG